MSDAAPTHAVTTPTATIPHLLKLLNTTSAPIQILVQREEQSKTFYVHAAVLTQTSKFFQNAMKPEWRSDPNKPIELHDTCSSDFEAYSQWLYTRLLPSEDSYRRFSALSGLYVLGERLMDDTFQQIIIDHMILRAGNTGAKLDRCPALETINIIYKGTSTNSPARRLVSDMWAHGALNPTFNLLSQLDPERDGELMRDMLQTLAKYHPMTTLGRPLPWQTQRERYRCDYVEQVDGDDRLAKKPKLDRQTS